MKTPLTPRRDRVLIRPTPRPDRTESGLHLVEAAEPEQTGTVLAIGPTRCPKCGHHTPVDFQVGDDVVFSWMVGQDVWLNDGDERYLMVRIDDVLAVLEPEGMHG